MSFGSKLKILRAFYEMDQRAMSKKLSISQPVYSRYENDTKPIYVNDPFVMHVADIFDVPPGWLCGGAGKKVFDIGRRILKKKTSEENLAPEVLRLLRQHEKLSRQLLRLIRQSRTEAGVNSMQA